MVVISVYLSIPVVSPHVSGWVVIPFAWPPVVVPYLMIQLLSHTCCRWLVSLDLNLWLRGLGHMAWILDGYQGYFHHHLDFGFGLALALALA